MSPNESENAALEAFRAARRAPTPPADSVRRSTGDSPIPDEPGEPDSADGNSKSATEQLRAPGVEIEEQHYRSVLKAISWRVTGTLDTMLISYLVTGNLAFAASIGFLEVFTKMGLYYAHERVWGKLKFGRKVKEIPPPDYQI